MKKLLFVIGFLIPQMLLVYSQDISGRRAQRLVEGSSFVRLDSTAQTIKFFQLTDSYSKSVKKDDPSELLKTSLGLSVDNEFRLKDTIIDKAGNKHNKYQQYYKGVMVDGKVFSLHQQNRNITSGSGEYAHIYLKDTQPTLSKQKAFVNAKNVVNAKTYAWDSPHFLHDKPGGELVIVSNDDGTLLAYKFDIYALDPISRDYVYINAHTGEFIGKKTRIRDVDRIGLAITPTNGIREITTDSVDGYYRLREQGRGGGIETYDNKGYITPYFAEDVTDQDNYWSDATDLKDAAYDVHFGTEATFDYYLNRHGRNSINEAGIPLVSYVHYRDNYSNAAWDGSRMLYGDGDGVRYNPFTSIDIVAHEITHGVIDYTANLVYENESGALNESFADIFAICVDFYANPDMANWTHGEHVTTSGQPFRDMSNPNYDEQPDTYLGQYWYSGILDHGGVHTNSGVMNYWFYLVVNGGSGTNDNSDDYSVGGIGIDAAADIAYRTLAIYLSENSEYHDARFFSIQAAIDLFGHCSPEVISVTNAWHAVGVGDRFSTAVQSGFWPSQTYSCGYPVRIQFKNQSINATSFQWLFDEEASSTEVDVSHTYTMPGTYDVRLVAHGNTLCNSTDTVIKTDYITIAEPSSSIMPTCNPSTNIPGDLGIRRFVMGDIDQRSGTSQMGYEDFTCHVNATLMEGEKYPIQVFTHPTIHESVWVWLDYNNDGAFNDSTELIYSSKNQLGTYNDSVVITGTFTDSVLIKPGVYFDVPIRLRVASDVSGNDLSGACTNSQLGQFEDYLVTLVPNTKAPKAIFSSNTSLVAPGDTIAFIDNSLHVPTSWEWHFEGGTPTVSTEKNPTVQYHTDGYYNVQLIVNNTFGSDTIEQVHYIAVRPEYLLGVDDTATSLVGRLFDAGGEDRDFMRQGVYGLLIDPPCADTILLDFYEFDLYTGLFMGTKIIGEYLTVYDGVDTSGVRLMNRKSGSTIPDQLIATSGAMYIEFIADFSNPSPTIDAYWTTVHSSEQPYSNFNISNLNPAYNSPIPFFDSSEGPVCNWLWDFGDGSSSTKQNPVHRYQSPGTKHVKLTASTAFYSSTQTKSLEVQGPAQYSSSLHAIDTALSCGSSINGSFTITNNGIGNMECALNGFEAFDSTSSTIYTEYYDSTSHYFSNLHPNTDVLDITITINGDYGASNEYAEVKLDGVPYKQANPNRNAQDFVFRYQLRGDSVRNLLADGILEVRLVNSSQVGIGYGSQLHEVRLQTGASQWVVAQLHDSLLTPGQSTTLDVYVDADTLSPGNYMDYFVINTNDQIDTINCSLEVVPGAYLSLVDTEIDFNTIYINNQHSQLLTIINDGCEVLTIDTITASITSISFDTTYYEVQPGDTLELNVNITPNAPGVFSGIIGIYNNHINRFIPVTAIAENRSILSYSSDTMSFSSHLCTPYIDTLFHLSNPGVYDLEYSIMGVTSYYSTSNIRMHYDESVSQHSFRGINRNVDSLEIIIAIHGDYEHENEFVEVWIEGDSVFCINPDVYFRYDTSYFVFSGAVVEQWLADGELQVTMQETYSVTGYSQHVVTIRTFNTYPTQATPSSGILHPGDSIAINYFIDATDLNPGAYDFSLNFRSNDPIHDNYNLPITLTIEENNLPVSGYGGAHLTDYEEHQFTIDDFKFVDLDTCHRLEKINIYATNGYGELYLDINHNGIVDQGESFTEGVITREMITMLKFKPVFGLHRISEFYIHFDVHDGVDYSLRTYETRGYFRAFILPDNEAPTDITLSSYVVSENMPSGTVVGEIQAVDPDIHDEHRYGFVDGTFSDLRDNEFFRVSGNQLLTRYAFDYEEKSSYEVYLFVSDYKNGSCSRVIPIHIGNVNEFPPVIDDFEMSINEHPPEVDFMAVSATDMDGDLDTLNYFIVGGNVGNAFAIDSVSGIMSFNNSRAINFEEHPVFIIDVMVSDGLHSDTAEFTFTLTDIPEETGLSQSHELPLVIYPNPSGGLVKIKSNSQISIGSVLSIFNAQGVQVVHEKIHAVQAEYVVDLNDLPKGVYLLKVLTNKRMFEHTIIRE